MHHMIQVIDHERWLYLITEYASKGEVFGEYSIPILHVIGRLHTAYYKPYNWDIIQFINMSYIPVMDNVIARNAAVVMTSDMSWAIM